MSSKIHEETELKVNIDSEMSNMRVTQHNGALVDPKDDLKP